MTRKIFRNIEKLAGTGKVIKQGNQIAEALYFISVDQEYLIAKSLSGEEEIPGHKRIRGRLEVISGERYLPVGETLTLMLEDGRKWEFFANRGDPISGTYEGVNVNPDGIIN